MTTAHTHPQVPVPFPEFQAHQPEQKRDRVSASQVIGELLLTIGVVLLLFAFYESFWTNIASHRMQDEAQTRLEEQWVNPRQAKTGQLGDAFAKMYIPAFGQDYQFAIIEGVQEHQLLTGPGHYPGTQLPGQDGNFAVAGHRVGKGAPFNDLGALKACDAVVVETQTEWVTYRVLPMAQDPAGRRGEGAGCLPGQLNERVAAGDYAGVLGREITLPGDIEVVNPIPGNRSTKVEPGMEGLITLTTCHPQFSNAERMIIHAVRTEVTPKDSSGAVPDAMKEVR
ncbi:class E sortase [Corynebacterium fournieri]|uniref:class E sortase n=1 Tax=Corynebacterium fournieri TaxID=1852390 RepID=UPI003F492619